MCVWVRNTDRRRGDGRCPSCDAVIRSRATPPSPATPLARPIRVFDTPAVRDIKISGHVVLTILQKTSCDHAAARGGTDGHGKAVRGAQLPMASVSAPARGVPGKADRRPLSVTSESDLEQCPRDLIASSIDIKASMCAIPRTKKRPNVQLCLRIVHWAGFPSAKLYTPKTG